MYRYYVTYAWQGKGHEIIIVADSEQEVRRVMDYYDIVDIK